MNFQLDNTNLDFNRAIDFINNSDNRNKILYLTGKAGTGKTTFLRHIKETNTKNIVVLAPTGIAALRAGGQTIHSFFKIPLSIFVPNDYRLRIPNIFETFRYYPNQIKVLNSLEILIIDEISMVRCDILDIIDRILRVYRRNESEIFGGIQVVLIGDAFQLSPIAKPEEWEILNQFYNSPFFFSSMVMINNTFTYIEFQKIYRQNEQDFINLLNKVRINELSDSDLELLNQKFNPLFSPDDNEYFITLATHNDIAQDVNFTRLSELKGQLYTFDAAISGEFPDKIIPAEKVLQIKEGAQVMFVKNDAGKKYYNGTIGKIKKIEKIISKEVSIEDRQNKICKPIEDKATGEIIWEKDIIIVSLPNGEEILLQQTDWRNVRYTWDKIKKELQKK